MNQLTHVNPSLSWWGPKEVDYIKVVSYFCPTNLTADSTFNAGSHCPVNSLGSPLDFTADSTKTLASSQYTTID